MDGTGLDENIFKWYLELFNNIFFSEESRCDESFEMNGKKGEWKGQEERLFVRDP